MGSVTGRRSANLSGMSSRSDRGWGVCCVDSGGMGDSSVGEPRPLSMSASSIAIAWPSAAAELLLATRYRSALNPPSCFNRATKRVSPASYDSQHGGDPTYRPHDDLCHSVSERGRQTEVRTEAGGEHGGRHMTLVHVPHNYFAHTVEATPRGQYGERVRSPTTHTHTRTVSHRGRRRCRWAPTIPLPDGTREVRRA